MLLNTVVYLSIVLIYLLGASSLQEAPDGSVCFNNCNGHGDCVDYSCHCWVGYVGDDCSTTFAVGEEIIPILSAGHFNLTRKNITQTITKNKYLLLGFSSYGCDKCIQIEPEYEKISKSLKAMKIPFGRVNADEVKSITMEFGAQSLPSLVFLHKMKPTLYKGVHSEEAVIQYIQKQTGPIFQKLPTIDSVYEFFNNRSDPRFSLSSVMVIGFFSQHQDIEEDDYEDFLEVAKDLQSNEDIYFGIVTNKTVINHFKINKIIDRTPSMAIMGEENNIHSINLDELYGEHTSMKDWLLKKAVPLVGKMTPTNFVLYEKLNIPMLLLFLDLTDEYESSLPGKIVGGKSGGILNEILIEEMKQAAKEHIDRIVFVYLDGNLYEDQMRSLGLYGGKERLPQLAFNTRDRTQAPFPEEFAINKETILQFCADYISGKIKSIDDSKDMAKKALQRAIPLDTKNQVIRKAIRSAPKVVQGVSEQWGDGIVGDQSAVIVTLNNFEEIVMNEEKDVVLLLHAKSCETCSHFNVYFKRMAHRFQELKISTLVIAQMDVSTVTPPPQYNMMIGPLPLLLMIPANAKYPPWTFYSGIGKVQPMMKWIEKHVSQQFILPNLPHLNEQQRQAYKEQVREREEYLEKKRLDEQQAMEEEEKAQEELRRRKLQKQQQRQPQQLKEEKEEEEEEEEAIIVSERQKKQTVSAIKVVPESDIDILEDHDEF
jgi:thiol-disulfide isomerase/thioredoxin